jgi:hypothetical protein
MQRGEPSLECAVPSDVVRVAAQIVTGLIVYEDASWRTSSSGTSP